MSVTASGFHPMWVPLCLHNAHHFAAATIALANPPAAAMPVWAAPRQNQATNGEKHSRYFLSQTTDPDI
jgi:hypothetical protein